MSGRSSLDGAGSNVACVVILLSLQGTAAVETHLRGTSDDREMPQGSVYAPSHARGYHPEEKSPLKEVRWGFGELRLSDDFFGTGKTPVVPLLRRFCPQQLPETGSGRSPALKFKSFSSCAPLQPTCLFFGFLVSRWRY